VAADCPARESYRCLAAAAGPWLPAASGVARVWGGIGTRRCKPDAAPLVLSGMREGAVIKRLPGRRG
jgi:penicillin-binding protein 1C